MKFGQKPTQHIRGQKKKMKLCILL